MNMVSLLALPLVIKYNIVDGNVSQAVGYGVLLIAVAAIAWSWWQSKRETDEMRKMDEEFAQQAAAAGAVETAGKAMH